MHVYGFNKVCNSCLAAREGNLSKDIYRCSFAQKYFKYILLHPSSSPLYHQNITFLSLFAFFYGGQLLFPQVSCYYVNLAIVLVWMTWNYPLSYRQTTPYLLKFVNSSPNCSHHEYWNTAAATPTLHCYCCKKHVTNKAIPLHYWSTLVYTFPDEPRDIHFCTLSFVNRYKIQINGMTIGILVHFNVGFVCFRAAPDCFVNKNSHLKVQIWLLLYNNNNSKNVPLSYKFNYK